MAGMSARSTPHPLDLDESLSPKEKNVETSSGIVQQLQDGDHSNGKATPAESIIMQTPGKASTVQSYDPSEEPTSSTPMGKEGDRPLEILDDLEKLTSQLFTKMSKQSNKKDQKDSLGRLSSDLEEIYNLAERKTAETDSTKDTTQDQQNSSP